ncbi:MAG: hypothetical protein NVSMB38_02980 [Ktedonobacteraceae bacterium]
MNKEIRHLGKYELQERLGQGGMAEVWKALDTQLQRYVAIKIMHANLQNDPDFLKRFEREARVIASLHHSNIVQIYDFQVARPPETENNIAYMVMDYIEGQTLADYLLSTSRIGRFPSVSDIIHIFTAISAAIDYAHQKGMIHRDIKPANIMLDKRNVTRNPMGKPILMDFGIVKLLEVSTATLSGALMGTPLYISPEQAQGHPGNERSDIYSLGVILYEICTGVPPFRGGNPFSIAMQHINMPPPPPATLNQHIPPALSEVILRSLAKDPMERFSSASAMTTALANAFHIFIPERSNVSTTPVNISTTLPTPAGTMPVANIVQNISSSMPVLSTPTTSGPPHISTSPLPPSPNSTRQSRRRIIGLSMLLLVVLLSASLGTFFVRSQRGTTNTAIANAIIGHAFFNSSGAFTEDSTNNATDELHLSIPTMPSPAAGNSYYLWLLSDLNKNPTTFIALGAVSLNHGSVDATYTTPQHTNLIATTSRLLITEEKTNPAPSSFSPNRHTWRYYAELVQTPTSVGDPVSSLYFLRRLLFEGDYVLLKGLHGGTDIQILRNTQKIFEWANNAKDTWEQQDFTRTYDQTIRILDYLDGPYVQTDVSTSTPLLVDPSFVRTPLITLSDNLPINGYLHDLVSQVFGVGNSLDVSPESSQLADQIISAAEKVEQWLESVRQYARQLVHMSHTQFMQYATLSILTAMQTQTQQAFVGQFDPSTGKTIEGVVQIHNNIQLLANFEIKKL